MDKVIATEKTTNQLYNFSIEFDFFKGAILF